MSGEINANYLVPCSNIRKVTVSGQDMVCMFFVFRCLLCEMTICCYGWFHVLFIMLGDQ